MGVILKGSSGSVRLTVPNSSGSTGDLSNYYTKPEVDALIPDVSGFATETYVDNAIANISTGGGETWETIISATADGETVSYVNDGYAYSEIEAYIVVKTGFTNQQNIYFTSGSKGTIYEEPRIYATVTAGWTGQIKLSKKIISAGLIESEIVLSNYANPLDVSGAKESKTLIKYGTDYSTQFSLESFSGHTIITQSGEAFPAGTIIFVRGR